MTLWVLTTVRSFWSSSVFKKLLDNCAPQLGRIYVNWAF
jgi:hypothetical protein